MRRCRGRTKSEVRCLKRAIDDSAYCQLHQDQAQKTNRLGAGITTGAATGAVLGGIPGAILGAVVGGVIGNNMEEETMSKSRVFISFDYDHDTDLKTLLIGQSKNDDTPFDISDWSVKEHIDGDWKKKVRTKLKRVDQILVICGEKTDKATGVSAEIQIAQEEGVPYFLLKGRKDKICKKPKSAKPSDKLHKWTWEKLKELIG